ncbi:hypothetical protein ACTOJ1_000813 [Shigella flexneri]
MTLYKSGKVYNTASETDIKKLAFKLTNALTSKGYSIKSSQLTEALRSCDIKNLHDIKDTFEVNFTLFHLFPTIDDELLTTYFTNHSDYVYPTNRFYTDSPTWHFRARDLFSVITPALIWLRNNDGLILNMDVLRDSFRFENIDSLVNNKKIPQDIVNKIVSFLHSIPRYNKKYGFNEQEEIVLDYHGYVQMNLYRLHGYLDEQFHQYNFNENAYSGIKLLAYQMRDRLFIQEIEIKHSDLLDALSVSLGYKNWHVFSAKYKNLNEAHMYKSKYKTLSNLLRKGQANQIMDAIVSTMKLDKYNIKSITYLQTVINILISLRDNNSQALTVKSIKDFLNIEKINSLIEQYEDNSLPYSRNMELSSYYFNEYIFSYEDHSFYANSQSKQFWDSHNLMIDEIIKTLNILENKNSL